jgi:hypothetical protein
MDAQTNIYVLADDGVILSLNGSTGGYKWGTGVNLSFYNHGFYPYDLFADPDGGFFVGGKLLNYQGRDRYLLARFDGMGTQLWQRIPYRDEFVQGQTYHVGGIDHFKNTYAAGSAGILRVSPIGTDIGRVSGAPQTSADIAAHNSGNMYLAGWSDNGARMADVIVVKYPPNSTNDLDGDGLPNNWEAQYYGNPFAGNAMTDEDSDGFNNWEEYIADTQPTNYSSRLQAPVLTGSTWQILNTTTARQYSIYSTTNLLDSTSWTALFTNETGTGSALLWVISNDAPVEAARSAVQFPQ